MSKKSNWLSAFAGIVFVFALITLPFVALTGAIGYAVKDFQKQASGRFTVIDSTGREWRNLKWAYGGACGPLFISEGGKEIYFSGDYTKVRENK